MATLDTSTLGNWVASVVTIFRAVLRLDASIFPTLIDHPDGLGLSLTVLALAVLALAVGQSVILFANRVPRRRFALSLLGGAFVWVLTVLLWSGSTWLAARFFFNVGLPWRSYAIVSCAAMAPAVYGVVLLLPYLGMIFTWILRIWIFVTVLVGVGIITALDFGAVLLICVGGWLLLELLTRLPLFDLAQLRDLVWRMTTGRVQRVEPQELADWLAVEASTAFDPGNGAGPESGRMGAGSSE